MSAATISPPTTAPRTRRCSGLAGQGCVLGPAWGHERLDQLPGLWTAVAASGMVWDPRRNGSAECWQLYGEVQGFALNHRALVRDLQQLTVDAYAAQHARREVDPDVPPISIAYALVGLHRPGQHCVHPAQATGGG
jgi:hypothetical protein